MRGITPAEGDFAFGKRDQTMIRDGYAMGVAAQILEYMFWSTERRFRVNHPVLSEQWLKSGGKGFRLSETGQVSVKNELATQSGGIEHHQQGALEGSTRGIDQSCHFLLAKNRG
jgi:hypothetical protein